MLPDGGPADSEVGAQPLARNLAPRRLFQARDDPLSRMIRHPRHAPIHTPPFVAVRCPDGCTIRLRNVQTVSAGVADEEKAEASCIVTQE
jgi:hypothetical protein